MTCDSSAGAGYTVNVCIDVPLNGATVSGDTNVTATVSATGGPGVAKVQFYLDSAYLLTDYESPYTFTLPTDTFVDGVSTLEVEAVMRDAFVTNRTSISAVFSNGVTTPPPAPTGFTPSLGTTPSAGEPFVVAATGDGASGQSTSDNVVNTISAIDPNLFLYLGDVYERGTYTEFKNWYGDDTRFGSFASITNPILGNHERSGGQWPGYDYYWGTPPADYSYDVDGWHFIGMNLQLGGPQSSQTEWLAADLAANTSACTVAYFHYPVLSVGPQGDTPNLFSTWTQLVDAGVDIVLTGHDHSYQRWVPMDRDFVADPDGATQFVLGTGGHGIQSFARTDSRLAAGADTIADAYGALKLELNTDGAAFSYINTSGNVLDAGTVDCGNGTADVTPPSVPGNVAGAAVGHTQVDVSWSPSTDNVGVDSYEIFRNGSLAGTVNGATLSFSDIGLQPSTTYSYTVEAVDGAGNRSGQSTPALNLTTLDPPSAFTVTAFADSWVDGSAVGSNFGAAADMRVDGSPDRRGYVRFDVSGVAGAVTSATLRVYANSSHSAGYEAQEVSSSTWGELSITYANAPGFGPSLGTSGPTTGGTYSEVDVTGYVDANGQYSFALTPLNNTNLRLATRESANPPELVIVQDVSGNTPPTAGDVVMATDEDVVGAWTPVVSDPDPDTLTCSIVSVAGNGSASVASDCSTGSYTPDADYNGPDSFVYQVSDGSLTDTGAVSVTVNPINDAPAADAQSVSVTQDGAVTVTMTGSDNDGDCPLTFAPGSPSNGSLGAVTNAQCNGGVASADVVYTPNASYTGTDSFTFTVEDPSTALSPPATVSLSVDPPQTNFTFVSAADSYVSASSRDSNYGSSTQIRVDGLPDRNGYVRFDVSGVAGAVTSATLRVYANSKHSQGFKVQEVSNNTWGELSITYANAPGFGPLLGASGPTPGNSYVDINVTGYVDANGQYSFALTPLNNTNLRLATRESANPPELVIVQDVSGNTPPTAGDVVMATDEDVVGAWTPVVSDPDPDTLTCSIVSVAGNGSASVASDCSTGSYTPDADYNGPDSFVYQVSDGSLTDTGAVSVTVNPINDAPAADAQSVSVTQDGAVTVTMTGSDNDGDCPLTFAPGSPSNGSLGAVTNAQCNGGVASADVVYTPNASYTGTDSFTFTVEDPSTALSPPATVSLSVDPPQTNFTFVSAADSYVSASSRDSNYGSSTQIRVDGLPDRNGYVRFDVSGVAGAVTSATLRVYANSKHSQGFKVQEVSNNTWGELSITYANAPGFGPLLGASGPTPGNSYVDINVTGYVDANGQYSFALTPLNNTNLRLATRESANPPELVIVQDVSGNTPPTAGDVVMATDEDVVGAWTPVVSDPDPDTLTCSIVSVAGNGSASVASDCSTGSYTPDADYNGPDSFVYQVSDGSLTDTGAVSVTVNPINDAPAADAQSVSVTQDGAVTVTMTGSDNDGDCPLTFAPGSPSNGSLGAVTNAQCNGGVASADVVYTPNASYTGTDSFTFTVEDPSTALSPPATVSLSVDPPQTALTFDITRDALTYSAVSQNTSSSYTGSLKSVVESALEELKLAGGGNILFAAGEMDLGSDHFEIDGVVDVTFAGQGMGVTTIQNFTNASADTEPFDAVRSDRLTIRDLTVSAGGSDRTTSDALDFDGGDDILIERVEVTDSRGRGIVFDGKDAVSQTGGTAERNVIRDCIVTNVPRDGIQLLAANGNTIENCHISNAGAEGIRVHLSSSSSAQPNKPSNDNTIRGNLIEDSAGNGITVTGGSRNLITGNTIVNNGTDGIRVFTSVSSLNCDDNVVDSNSAQGNRYGLIIASSQCHRTVVGDNNFTGNSSGAILDNGTDTIYTSSDTEAPSAPGNLATLDVQATQVTLGWDASTDNVGVTGYDVYRDGGLIDTIGTTTTYQDTTVTPLTTYQYEVRGRDATGNISDPSNGVNATTPAGSPVLTLFPVDDATVRESLPTNNYGSSPALEVDGSSIKDVLMSFDVSGIGSSSITSATLRLYAVDSSSDGGNFFAVTDTTWNETSVTWATAPPGDGGALGSLGSVSSGNWYELDVTALITGDGKVSIRVSSTNSNGADYASKEDSSGNIPELVIVTQ